MQSEGPVVRAKRLLRVAGQAKAASRRAILLGEGNAKTRMELGREGDPAVGSVLASRVSGGVPIQHKEQHVHLWTERSQQPHLWDRIL